MKKLFLFLTVFVSGISLAQLYQGNSLINAHAGFGLALKSGVSASGQGIDVTSKTTIPPVELSYEYAVRDNITVGGFAGYSARETVMKMDFMNNTLKSTYNESYFFGGAMGNYHFMNEEKIDLYGGVKLGYLSYNMDMQTDDGGSNSTQPQATTDVSGLVWAIQLGGRYFFSEHLAAHLVLGYGISYVSFGLTYKL